MVRPPDLSFETLARFFAHVKTLKSSTRRKALNRLIEDNVENNSAFLFDFYRLLLPQVFQSGNCTAYSVGSKGYELKSEYCHLCSWTMNIATMV